MPWGDRQDTSTYLVAGGLEPDLAVTMAHLVKGADNEPIYEHHVLDEKGKLLWRKRIKKVRPVG